MTYSIIGWDPTAGEMGIILQSYYYGCAPRTVLASPGVGIVAMQMVPEMRYGVEGLEGMASGRSPADILAALVSSDEGRGLRQVAMMNAAGATASYTGSGCIPACGHVRGDGYSAQGAMVESERVWILMAEVFRAAKGALADRLISAMKAGEAAGGDIRGRRAGALVVVSDTSSTAWTVSRPIDIRVDEHQHPLQEIERHLALQRHMGAIEQAFEAGLGGDLEEALNEFQRIAVREPDDPDVTMRYAILLAKSRNIPAARVQLDKMRGIHHGWEVAVDRLVQAGLLPNDKALIG